MENATLVLKTSDATISQYANTLNTWSNINLRNLMGNMYEKYETFNLCLISIFTATASSTLGNTTNDLNVVVNLSGLPFINQTYNTKTGNNESTSIITVFNFNRSSWANVYYSEDNYLTFGKSQDLCDITINLTQISGATVTSSVSYPNVIYKFSIIGVPNQNDKLLTPPARMEINRLK